MTEEMLFLFRFYIINIKYRRIRYSHSFFYSSILTYMQDISKIRNILIKSFSTIIEKVVINWQKFLSRFTFILKEKFMRKYRQDAFTVSTGRGSTLFPLAAKSWSNPQGSFVLFRNRYCQWRWSTLVSCSVLMSLPARYIQPCCFFPAR